MSVRQLSIAVAAVMVLGIPVGWGGESPSPYTAFETRDIKALPTEEIEGLLAGEGMGQALAAELNRYPGPKHVLELAAEIGLDETQLAATRAIFERMQIEAKQLGAVVVEQERELDRLFAAGAIDDSGLQQRLQAIAELRGRLRYVHLSAHLKMAELLSPAQLQSYVERRGYGGGQHGHGKHSHHQ